MIKLSMLNLKNFFQKTKDFIRESIVKSLIFVSSKNIQKYNPYIVAITGNVGKTSTKDYISKVLSESYNVRASEKSFNSEIGIPLTILGEKNQWGNVFGWVKIIFSNLYKVYFEKVDFPEVLVLEVGADKPGDIFFATSYVKPDMVVLTAFAEHPVHLENFPNREAFVKEKKYLVDALKSGGTLIYNSDDRDMSDIADSRGDVKKISYGKSSNQFKILTSTFIYDESGKVSGSKIIFEYSDDPVQSKKSQGSVDLVGVVGFSHAYAVMASIASGIEKGMQMDDILDAITGIDFPKSRLRIFKGINNSTIIDDTYNASPKAVELALTTVQSIISNGRKVAVLGHMAEIGQQARSQHIKIGALAAGICSAIILVGRHNEWYLEGVRAGRFNLENVFLFENSDEAKVFLKENVKENDLILVKGSQSARMEKVVVEILENQSDLYDICRQEQEWKKR